VIRLSNLGAQHRCVQDAVLNVSFALTLNNPRLLEHHEVLRYSNGRHAIGPASSFTLAGRLAMPATSCRRVRFASAMEHRARDRNCGMLLQDMTVMIAGRSGA